MFPDMQLWLRVLLAIAVAAVVAFGSTPIVKSFAQKVGAMDNPGEARRIHTHPIPRMGGMAIFLGFLLSVVLFAEISKPVQGILIGSIRLIKEKHHAPPHPPCKSGLSWLCNTPRPFEYAHSRLGDFWNRLEIHRVFVCIPKASLQRR